ncbi:DsbA family protein [Vulgatibacter sp.]|uniref:DsbA family oxidoreductase n=1 Tax=Vulgatibacter sp. TaxID=1971226 RepID=UPI003568DFCE
MQVVVELFVDALCPFSLIAARRVREAVAEYEGAARLRLRALPLVPDPSRLEKAAGSREGARLVLARRLEEAAGLTGGENLDVGVEAFREGRLRVVSSLVPLAAVKWAQIEVGDVGAWRLYVEVASRYLEHGEDVGDPMVLADAAREHGLPWLDLIKALEAGVHGRDVARDRQHARVLGIRATPAAVLDGRVRLEGLSALDEYREAIAQRLLWQSKPREAQTH